MENISNGNVTPDTGGIAPNTSVNGTAGIGGTTTSTGGNGITGAGGTAGTVGTGTTSTGGITPGTGGTGTTGAGGIVPGTGVNGTTGAGGTATGTGTNGAVSTGGVTPGASGNGTSGMGTALPRIGGLKIQCFRGDDYIPIDGARIIVRGTADTGNINNIELVTDSVGLTQIVELPAPPLEYSLNENSNQVPYSLYDITVERNGFEPVVIRGCQVFPTQIAYQIVNLETSLGRGPMRQEVIDVPPNTLNGDYPPKIPEEEDKPLPEPTSGVVLPEPIVPEYITVHQGGPNDTSAPNYRVPFKDYIKNVASSEIYSTWTESTIRANVFCIISFTLNRIFTEWYRGKGKNFDITSSTAYDHAFTYGRNFYDNISRIVDEIFSTYVRRIGKKQPLLTQYCDGKRVSCPEWLSQWGSQTLGTQGRVPYEILRYYYGSDIELVTAKRVAGSPRSYPGYNLTIGSSGPPVRTIQGQLNRISRNYPLIPRLAEDGRYGPKTAQSVRTFQQVFTLPQTGVVDYATWYRISDIYVGVTRIAELTTTESSREWRGHEFIPPVIPGFDDDRDIPKFYY